MNEGKRVAIQNDFLEKLVGVVERIAHSGDLKSVQPLLEMTVAQPQTLLLSSLAEAFARMVVTLEAKEFQLECTIENLQRVKMELELANHDPLTGLPNRVIARDRLHQGILRARSTARILAVLYLDLDRFKWVNDNLGHPAGDELLRQVSQRLRGCVRNCDIVARLGGDEFLCIMTDLESDDAAVEMASRFVETLAEPFVLSAGTTSIGTSIGIALYPHHGQSEKSLIDCADKALYQAKHAGRNGYRISDQKSHKKDGKCHC